MKTAICISGMPRSFKENYHSLKENILDQLPGDYDIFISTWNPVSNDLFGADGTVGEFYDLYRPVAFEVEDWRESLNDTLFKYDTICKIPNKRGWKPSPRLMPMYYKIWLCHKLMVSYMFAHKIRYDAIIRTRTDLQYTNKIDQEELHNVAESNNGDMFVYLRKDNDGGFRPDGDWVWDQFAIGNYLSMCNYSSSYIFIETALEANNECIPELILRYTLDRLNTKTLQTTMRYELKR